MNMRTTARNPTRARHSRRLKVESGAPEGRHESAVGPRRLDRHRQGKDSDGKADHRPVRGDKQKHEDIEVCLPQRAARQKHVATAEPPPPASRARSAFSSTFSCNGAGKAAYYGGRGTQQRRHTYRHTRCKEVGGRARSSHTISVPYHSPAAARGVTCQRAYSRTVRHT